MAKYKVKTIVLAVRNNRIAKFDELVDDSELTVNPSELISTGFIELVESSETVEVKEAELVELPSLVDETETVEAPTVKKAPTASQKATK